MSVEISPGSVVTVRVTSPPRSERAAKTLARVFAKDAANKRLARRRHRIRAQEVDGRRRGGRIWYVRPKAPLLVQPTTGDTCRVRATLDVVADLRSVAQCIEVSSER